jgi:hypothetical protein
VHVDLSSPADVAKFAVRLEKLLEKTTSVTKVEVLVPLADAAQLSWLYRNARVTSAEATPDSEFTRVVVAMDPATTQQFEGQFRSRVARVPVLAPDTSFTAHLVAAAEAANVAVEKDAHFHMPLTDISPRKQARLPPAKGSKRGGLPPPKFRFDRTDDDFY